jgi:thiamine-phosphate pyrophosphorylase
VSRRPPTRKSRIVCYVTDGRQLSASPEQQNAALIEKIFETANAGVDWIQIREKDLSGAQLADLAREIIAKVTKVCRVIINDRLDVACAVGAAGVHLGEKSISVADARDLVHDREINEAFVFGASVHSIEAAEAAQREGAHYVIFGPIFATPSKAPWGVPQGLERLKAISRALTIPVLAIGGITQENAADCYAHGASGVAAIRLFQQAEDLPNLLQTIRVSK